MVLSASERSYLYESLKQNPPMRSDGREISQFRPMESQIDIIEGSNGSARITLSDGSEALVSVKSKVVETKSVSELIEVDIEIDGHREDSSLVLTMKSILQSLYLTNIDPNTLKLTQRFSYKLYIDVLVIANFSYPLTLVSFASFLALKHTYLPKLVSSVDDKEIEEQPQFHDYEMTKLELKAPIIFTLAIIDKNYIVDPNSQEIEVCDNGLIVSWFEDQVISPLTNIKLNDTNIQSIKPELILKSVDLVKSIGAKVVKSLSSI